jgi:hypothetical protein
MPAVDLARLAHQIEHVRSAIANPAAFRTRFRDLMDFYTDRIRRPGVEGGQAGVPAQVVRAVANGLVEETGADVEKAALLADVLWSVGSREARRIALTLVQRQPPTDLQSRVLAWAETTSDPDILAQLAGPALAPARADNPKRFLDALSDLRWHARHARRAFALRALAAAAEDRTFQDIPRILEMLAPRGQEPIGEERRGLRELASALAQRSPGETARCLAEALERRRAWAYPAALAALEALPGGARRSLERSLVAARAAGIMPEPSD